MGKLVNQLQVRQLQVYVFYGMAEDSVVPLSKHRQAVFGDVHDGGGKVGEVFQKVFVAGVSRESEIQSEKIKAIITEGWLNEYCMNDLH